jgi:membrane-bound serine protease (ClpP class)
MLSGGNRIALGRRGRLRLVDPLGIVNDIGGLVHRRVIARNPLGEGPAGRYRVGGATQSERVERLHQPALSIRTLSEIQVSDPVEQHDHPSVGQHPSGLIEPQGLHDRHAPHGADLHVDDHQIGRPLIHQTRHLSTLAADRERGLRPTECSRHLIDDPVSIGGEEDVHGRDTTGRRRYRVSSIRLAGDTPNRPHPTGVHVRTTLKAAILGVLSVAMVALIATPAGAQDGPSSEDAVVAPVDVLQVDGLIDPVVVSEISDAVAALDTNGSQALILQVNSRGVVVDNDTFTDLLETISAASRPVAVWVGPSGARLLGASVHLLAVADVSGMAPGAEVGYLDTSIANPVADTDPAAVDALEALVGRSVGLTDARTLGVFRQRISDEGIATIANMLDALDGYEGDGIVLETTEEEITDDGTVQRTTTAVPRFSKPGLVDQLFHTVASPPVAYLLLLVGLGLLLFEFFTAGVGVAAVVGIASTLLSAYGLDVLPARGWAVALLVCATIAFAIDVQVGLPRVWTGIGITSTIVGSLWLFEPLPGTSLRPSWLTLIVGIGGVMLAYITGMPSMTRTRFATPTVGRDWMLGSEGTVVSSVAPDGIVRVGEAEWRARTNRATPVEVGETIRVVAIDGVTLEVEPLEGAARDYRR